MADVIDMSGKKVNRWTVLRRNGSDRYRNALWVCLCACGNTRNVTGNSLRTRSSFSCGCTRKKAPFESLYNRLKLQEARYPVELTYEQFSAFTKITECHYCEAAIAWRPHYAGKGGYNLDRKDNLLGYTADNCVVCCKRCNLGKGSLFSYDEWLSVGALIKSWRGQI